MLTRRTPLRRRAFRPTRSVRFTGPTPDVKQMLRERSDGWCEAQLPGCTGQATDAAHRISRKMGGRPVEFHRLSGLLHLCRACHSWTHARPVEAKDLGLMLDEGRDPTVEPVAYQNAGWVVLDDDGTLWPCDGERVA